MRSTLFILLVSFFLMATSAGLGHTHSGGLDQYGCHTNRTTGVYHCHSSNRRSTDDPPAAVAVPASTSTPTAICQALADQFDSLNKLLAIKKAGNELIPPRTVYQQMVHHLEFLDPQNQQIILTLQMTGLDCPIPTSTGYSYDYYLDAVACIKAIKGGGGVESPECDTDTWTPTASSEGMATTITERLKALDVRSLAGQPRSE